MNQSPDSLTSRTPLTVIVITHNEERNLRAFLLSVREWAQAIFVVDSGSTDSTIAIAGEFAAIIVVHPFESHAKQWQWALGELPIETDWVLALDADQRVTPELRDEISNLIGDGKKATEDRAGYFIKRRQIFRGQWIRHGGYYPKYLLKLFRLSAVWIDDRDLVDHHFHVKGQTANLHHDIIEDNQNEADLSVWIEKHNRYAVLQAQEEFNRAQNREDANVKAAFLGSPDERTLWRKHLWGKAPLFVRPALYFFYRYFLRLGFLDGKQGFIFHFLQACWYRLLVDIHLDELRRQQRSVKPVEQTLPKTRPANGAGQETTAQPPHENLSS